ncbi:MAG: DegT/DnrJ/EryC1/StrS family aminotransferase [Actinomycetota bacterium]
MTPATAGDRELDDVLPPPPGEPMPEPWLRMTYPLAGDEELKAIDRALRSGVLNNGPEVEAFEREFAERHGTRHAVALANGTDALTAIYLALGIGRGDEVIVPAMTFVSSATSIVHAGATPVFAEVEPETFTLDPASAEAAVTARTRAILAVHYAGQAASVAELAAVSERAGAVLIEDAAQAHGGTYRGRSVGSLGHAAMFSFAPNKNVTMGEGGMITTDDPELDRAVRLLRNHGQISQYVYDRVGYNWRMSEVHGAMGRAQLGKLDNVLAAKRQNAAWMERRLAAVAGVRTPVTREDRDHTFMLYTLLLDRKDDRDRLMVALGAEGIESKVYFPPVHRQPIFDRGERFLVTEDLCSRILSIPFHARVSTDDLERIAQIAARTISPQW